MEYRSAMPASNYQQQKLRVCEVCSAFLGIHDNDRRLADHFGGKLHVGFITLRSKLAELQVSVMLHWLVYSCCNTSCTTWILVGNKAVVWLSCSASVLLLSRNATMVTTILVILCFYARKQNASRVFAIVWAFVRPSVSLSIRPSVTLVSCIKTVQARITKSSPWTAPRSLVYRDKILCHWVQGFPSNEGVKEGYPP